MLLTLTCYDGVPIYELSILCGLGVDGIGRDHCTLDSSRLRICGCLLWQEIPVRHLPDSRLSMHSVR